MGELRLHVVLAGDPSSPPVLLLHGFPECWYGWHRQIGPLVDAGYRVIVPDQRGYGRSDKPHRSRDYGLDHLQADILGLVRALDLPKPALVGHDWGGAVAWALAMNHPERFTCFVPLNIPDPRVLRHALLTDRRQLRRSWYMFAFQIPGMAERLLAANQHRLLVSTLYANTVHRSFDDDDIAQYRAAWSQPGAMKGMIAWYRAVLRAPPAPMPATSPLPACMIWGRQDAALGFSLVEPSMDRLPHGELHVIDDAAHFVQHDRPDEVARLIIDFLRRVGPPTASG